MIGRRKPDRREEESREGSEKDRLGKEMRREMCCQEVMTKEDKM